MLINEIIVDTSLYKRQDKKLAENKDTILLYTNSKDYIFTKIRKPYDYPDVSSIVNHLYKEGRYKEAEERKKLGAAIGSVWKITFKKKQIYPTTKNEKLLRRIICLSTK